VYLKNDLSMEWMQYSTTCLCLSLVDLKCFLSLLLLVLSLHMLYGLGNYTVGLIAVPIVRLPSWRATFICPFPYY
jgi:hypothetical protein